MLRLMQYKVKVQDNSVAIIGWEEGTAGQVHSWIEQDGKYHIACFVNPSINKLIHKLMNPFEIIPFINLLIDQFSGPILESTL